MGGGGESPPWAQAARQEEREHYERGHRDSSGVQCFEGQNLSSGGGVDCWFIAKGNSQAGVNKDSRGWRWRAERKTGCGMGPSKVSSNARRLLPPAALVAAQCRRCGSSRSSVCRFTRVLMPCRSCPHLPQHIICPLSQQLSWLTGSCGAPHGWRSSRQPPAHPGSAGGGKLWPQQQSRPRGQ